jgi:hypothetical protein
LYATPRSKRESRGGLLAREMERLSGHAPMPWQRDVLDVAYEVEENGRLRFRYVMFKVPRQSGKTDLGDAVLVGRCMNFDGQGALLMAQDRNMSRRRLLDEIVDRRLDMNPHYEDRYRERRLTGSEEVRFSSGSWLTIAPVTPHAGHGLTLDVAFIDELWSHDDFRALQALSPTMVTRPEPQVWMASTEGTELSTVLDYWTALGRESVGDEASDICYFEWSKPDDADIYDEDRWAEWMPALGYTQSVAAIRSEARTLPEGEFLRAYGNVRTPIASSVFGLGVWEACADPKAEPTGGLFAALDITPDRSRSCIAVCGGGVVEVVEDRSGTGWLVERLLELDARWGFYDIAVDNVGPGVSVASELEYRGARVHRLNTTDLKAACGRFYDAVVEGTLKHRGQSVLDDAVQAAKRRTLLDAWAWSRKGTTNVSPVVAATLAYWAYAEQPESALSIY